MSQARDLLSEAERTLSNAFLDTGRVVFEVEDRPALDRIRRRVVALAADHLGLAPPGDDGAFLDDVAGHVSAAGLNALRLAVIDGMAAEPAARADYLAVARRHVEVLVGNELAMQRRLNLSVQLPGDRSSLLPVHADVWSGDSPYEVVLWLPLVDCRATKSMYLLPPDENADMSRRLGDFAHSSAETLFEAIRDRVEFVEVRYGEAMLFSQTLMHGNRVNEEAHTRWSLNCRLKSLLSPYADKRLGEFFEPVTVRAATRIGMSYRAPEALGA